jgi:Zn-dependent M28 family amino/carboxypeptidase
VVALVEVSSRDFSNVRLGSGGSRGAADRPRGIPSITMASEPYGRILRLLEHDKEVELELTIDAEFHSGDGNARNVIAEIPGTDKNGGLVLAGAHFDSWHPGTGTNDNGAGSAVILEAARILKTIGVKPKRTIRFILWSGEEQGLLGSRAYVAAHYATRPENTDADEQPYPPSLRKPTWPITPTKDHAKVSAYFNLDNGAGKIRGIYAQENSAVVPIFEAWLEPFHDLGATIVTTNATGATDHVPFDAVGIPGFQFVQDQLDYSTRTHHTELDTYEHAPREDMMQASTIMAAFVYNAAMRDEPLPRKPLPREPEPRAKKKSDEEKKDAPKGYDWDAH